MQEFNEAIVLAGGLGTRLQGVVNDLPKCMAPVAGRPFLEYVLDYLLTEKIQHTILSVGYLKDKIVDHFGIEYKGMALDYAVESVPLGTGGAVKFASNFLHDDTAFILNGDTFFEVSLSGLSKQFVTDKADIALVLKTVPDAGRYGNVVLNSQNRITGFLEKTALAKPGLINGGIYLINRKCLRNANLPEKFSLEKDFFEKYLETLYLTGFESNAFFIDIGIPEDYDKAQRLFSTT
jgi:D-glycero-alpha-D-manno-heptose 1-phosphate guanylyltransferase